MRNSSGMLVVPERRISSWVMTKAAAAVWINVWGVLEAVVTSTFISSSSDRLVKSSTAAAAAESTFIMVILEGSNRCPGSSDDELAQLFRSFVAYSGKCSIEGEKFVTDVDLASDPSWVGTAQLRYYR